MRADRDRWTFATGVAFVALAVAALVVIGKSPSASDSADDVVQYFVSNRDDAMLGATLSGLAVIFFLGFAAAVANRLWEAGEGLAGGIVVAAATAFTAVQLVLCALFATLAYSVAQAGDGGVTKGLFDVDVVLGVFAGLATGLFILAAAKGLKRIGAIPGWLGLAGTVIS